ncbi:MAG: transposase [Proteobacteria bacterium]|nr:transposase [Pseudomonadota bacterium]
METEDKKGSARRQYDDQFKADAVEQVLDKGRRIVDVARGLGVGEGNLGKWVQQARIDRGMGPEGKLTTEEREELTRLRRENRMLKEERDILKKATAFFAKAAT